MEEKKVTNLEILLYGFGGIATTLIAFFKSRFQMIFLSDVAGISVALVGSLMMGITIFDAINDPIIGGICDRTNSRFGRYRPHMMMGTVCLSFVTILMFVVPDISTSAKTVYYVVLMALFSVFFTQQCIPWQALNSVLTTDVNQRNLLLASRQLFGGVSAAATGFLTLGLVDKLGGSPLGWRNVAIIYSVVSVVSMYLAAYGARKVDYKDAFVNAESMKMTFKDSLNILVGNRALIFAGLTYGLVGLFNGIRNGISVYYFKYVINDVSLVATSSLASMVCSFLVVPITTILLKRIGKKNTLYMSMIAGAVFPVSIMIMRRSIPVSLMFVLYVASCAFGGIANFAVISLIPDCTDYTEYKYHIQGAGTVNSIATFMQKMCTSLTTFIIGTLLGTVGYTVETAYSTPVGDMILNICSYVPLVILALCLTTIFFYPIDNKFSAKMHEELMARRSKAAAERATEAGI